MTVVPQKLIYDFLYFGYMALIIYLISGKSIQKLTMSNFLHCSKFGSFAPDV